MNTTLSRSHKAQSLVEFALILPVLLMFIVIIIDIGRVFYYYTTIFNAAREGARAAVVDPTIDTEAELRAASLKLLVGVSPSDLSFTGSKVENKRVTVRITYSFRPVTPLAADLIGSGGVIPLVTISSMKAEW
jgi:Flp pilus assembly protein TadG